MSVGRAELRTSVGRPDRGMGGDGLEGMLALAMAPNDDKNVWKGEMQLSTERISKEVEKLRGRSNTYMQTLLGIHPLYATILRLARLYEAFSEKRGAIVLSLQKSSIMKNHVDV